VLVVSGLHVTILCGGLWQLGQSVHLERVEQLASRRRAKRRRKRFRERSRRSRVAQALYSVVVVVLLVGVTGFTPSVLRASGAVLITSAGVLLLAPADALTSLGIAGVCMTAGNSYAVCDVGFELSFASVLGTLAGAELARRMDDAAHERWQKRGATRRPGPLPRLRRVLRGAWGDLRETVCISLGASAAVFPVLVLRGMGASLYALVSGVAVVWAVQPILLCGLAAALAGFASGFVPWLTPVYTVAAACGEMLVHLLNLWVRWVAAWPSAMLHFETAYPALAALVILGLVWLAVHWKVRARRAVPVCAAVLLAAVLLGGALDQGVVNVAMLGSSTTPVVVVTQGQRAMVLFRGGETEAYRVQTYLDNRSISQIDVLVDLRMKPANACALADMAAQTIVLDEQPAYRQLEWACGSVSGVALRTNTGSVAQLQVGDCRLATVSGSIGLAQKLQADYLLASGADPRDAVEYAQILSLGTGYTWLEQEAQAQEGNLPLTAASTLTLRLRPQGGEQLLLG
jgi:competence protein ComEC